MILRRFIYYCGKFHTDTINQTIFGKEFVKLVWGKLKLFRATLNNNTPKMVQYIEAIGNFRLTLNLFFKASYDVTVADFPKIQCTTSANQKRV